MFHEILIKKHRNLINGEGCHNERRGPWNAYTYKTSVENFEIYQNLTVKILEKLHKVCGNKFFT